MKSSKEDKLNEIFNNDPLGLLNIEKPSSQDGKTEEQRLIESFEEISDFFEAHGREPNSENSLEEHTLKSRLDGIRSNPKKVKILLPYDFHGLLRSDETKSVSVEEILGDDPLKLLDIQEGDNGIFDLTHVKKTDRIRPEYISRRRKCEDFYKYGEGFSRIHQELKDGRRKLVEFNENDVAVGKYFVLRGIVLYLEKNVADYQEKQFDSGSRTRLDGRTRCIFDNGTESSMLLRSLNKALCVDGFGISEIIERKQGEAKIMAEDVQNGHVYVLRSLSNKPEIAQKKNLYKVGYSVGDITERIKNAPKEPTYLLSDVQPVLAVRCFNLNVENLETTIHEFFREVNVVLEVKDDVGVIYHPREWFVAPLEIIQEAIQLIVDGQIQHYKYIPSVEKIILRDTEKNPK
jgi:hypothetical protein